MAQPYVGEVRIFAGNFAPAGGMFCKGQLLPISENETLFQLIGTTYGGDGKTNFGLPNLQGRAPMHPGQGGSQLAGRLHVHAATTGADQPFRDGEPVAYARDTTGHCFDKAQTEDLVQRAQHKNIRCPIQYGHLRMRNILQDHLKSLIL